MTKYTVMIPLFGHVNWMHVALHALRRNAVSPPKIVVAWSDPRISRKGTWAADSVNWDGGPFPHMQAFVKDHHQWLVDNEVTVVDVTEQCTDFKARCQRGEVPTCTHFDDGCDIAFKNNLSLDYVDTEWCVPNWDADFYPGPQWDRPLVEQIERGVPEKTILIPTHVQPDGQEWVRDLADAWEDTRERIACNRLAMYSPTRETTEGEFFAFCQRWSRNDVVRELCGVRDRLHWVPTLIRTDDVRRLKYNYQGAGYDIEFDNRLGANGFHKLGFRDSFILHKGYIPLETGQCPLT